MAPSDSTASVDQPPPYDLRRGLIFAGLSLLVGVTQGLGINVVTVNLPAIQGALGASPTEGAWLLAAYFATSISASALLVKFRFQFGLRLFADLGLGLFILVTALHLVTNDLRSAIALRAAQGLAAAPLSSLSLLYMINAWPSERKNNGIAFGLASTQLAVPLARVLSPDLLQIGQWHGLYVLELGLALLSLAGVTAFRLPPVPQAMKFEWGDALSFALLAPGLGVLAIVLSLGRYVWWLESRWLGVCLAIAVPLLCAAILVELHRKRPLLDVRWLSSGEMLRFLAVIVIFRFALSEQTSGVIGLLQNLGLINDQMQTLFWIILIATAVGFLFVGLTINPDRPLTPIMTGLVLIALAAWRDSHSTNLSRPEQFYLTQGLVGFAGALFLPPAMLFGMSRALARSYAHLVSYTMVFSAGQNIGSLMSSAFIGSFIIIREKFHSNQLAQAMTLADPLVAQRVRQLSAAYGHVLGDAQLRAGQGAVLLGQVITREAYVLAYNDAFQLIAICSVVGLVWMIALRIRTRLAARRLQEAVA